MDILRFFANYKLHIFWTTLYTLVSIGIFVERAYCEYETWAQLSMAQAHSDDKNNLSHQEFEIFFSKPK